MSDTIFKNLSILSDPFRVRILRILSVESCTVGELVVIFEIPQSTASRHLKTLLESGWLSKRSVGASSWFAFQSKDLSETKHHLWELISKETKDLHPRDLNRLESILAMRKTDSQAFFQRIGQKWSALRSDLFGEDFLMQALVHLLPPKSVIADLGCGTGDAVAALAPAVASVIGIDRSHEMLALCRQKMGLFSNVDLRQGSIESLPINDSELDAALCILVLHHIADLNQAFSEMVRALKPGGRLIVVDMLPHRRKEFQINMGHQHMGFSQSLIEKIGQSVGLTMISWNPLPKADGALGPELFLSMLQNRTSDST